MNPVRLWRIYRRANKLGNLLQEAAVSKSLFTSRIFWWEVLNTAAELAQVIPLPPGYTKVIGSLITIGLRLVTDTPVHILPPKK